jgi:tRNA pseudouridine55 synthase
VARKSRNCKKLNGILLLDKAPGMTSNRALQNCKRLLHACKAGHTGSLDPIATGLLPLCFGEATKVSEFLINADKRYRTVFKLGQATNTQDAEGEVIQTRPVTASVASITMAVERFVGEIEQVPPMFSAIKVGGQALYKLARQGIDVYRPSRRVLIKSIEIRSIKGDELELEIACSKGTYIRTLAHDLGEKLGCGAHVRQLRRLAVGDFDVNEAVTLETLEQTANMASLLLPMDVALTSIPDVNLTPLAAHYLLQGQPVSVRHAHPPGWVRLYEGGMRFLGMGQVLNDGRVAPRKLVSVDRKA